MLRSQPGRQVWTLCRILALLFVAAPLLSAERPSVFEEANRLYEQGKYAEAASHYESMAKAGRISASVFFNLGNAWFKQGELGRALLNYRKAEALSPRDPDIQANLQFTRERVSGSLSIPQGIWRRALNYLTLNELVSFVSPLFWVWAGLFAAVRLRPGLKPNLRIAQAIIGTVLVLSICVLVAALQAKNGKTVVIISKKATVHLGPLPESQPAFTATDGTELRLVESRSDWFQVSDRSGRTGWVSTTDAAVF
jgi:hypothetical protein